MVWVLTHGHFVVLFDSKHLIHFAVKICDGFWIRRFPKCLYFVCTEDSARNNTCGLNSLQVSRKYIWHRLSLAHKTDAYMCMISSLWTGFFSDIVKAAWDQLKLKKGKILIWSLLSYINMCKADFKSRLCSWKRNNFQGALMKLMYV